MQQLIYIFCSLLIFVASNNLTGAQSYPYDCPQYDFINYDESRFVFHDDSLAYNKLFEMFTLLVQKGEGQVNVLHIGDSHVQADYFSGRMRERLQTFFPGLKGGRGFVFPCKLAHTNNPFNLAVDFTGTWTGCRNIEANKTIPLGIAGMAAFTTDSITTLRLRLKSKDYQFYDFNKILIFHNPDSTSFEIDLENYPSKQIAMENPEEGYTAFILDHYTDTITLKFTKTDTIQKNFTLYGLSFDNYDPGVIYSAVGVNGAEAGSFVGCSLFSKHLNVLDPDWVIISLGTNEAYGKIFSAARFESNMDTLITRIRESRPGIPILLTVPGDSYRRRRYLNHNIPLVREAVFRVAIKHKCTTWDLFNVMGGLNSIVDWQKAGLTANDKLHLARQGYYLQGDLLFNAFLRSYDNYLENKKKNSN